MFKDILAGLQQPQHQGNNPMMQQPMMPMQAPQQPFMTDPWGQQTSGIRAALMGRFMNAR